VKRSGLDDHKVGIGLDSEPGNKGRSCYLGQPGGRKTGTNLNTFECTLGEVGLREVKMAPCETVRGDRGNERFQLTLPGGSNLALCRQGNQDSAKDLYSKRDGNGEGVEISS